MPSKFMKRQEERDPAHLLGLLFYRNPSRLKPKWHSWPSSDYPLNFFFVAVKCPQGGHPKGTTFDKIEFTEMLTSFSQTWALRRCCQETLSPIEISSSFPEKNLFELWNILLGQLRRALEEYLRIQRLVSPFFFLLCSLSHYEQHGSHDGFCVFNLLAVSLLC